MLWSFLAEFADKLGVHPAPLPALLAAVQTGSASSLLVNVHVGLIRYLQAEAEVAATGISHAVRTCGLRTLLSACASALLSAQLSWRCHVAHIVCMMIRTAAGFPLRLVVFVDALAWLHVCLDVVASAPRSAHVRD